MKKLFTLAIAILSFAVIQAQTKIKKTDVVGKWTAALLDMPGTLTYNVETDSMTLGDAIKNQVTDPSQLKMVVAQMKTQLSMMAKLVFDFKADGTAVITDPVRGTQSATYSVDEEKSTISTTETAGDKVSETLEAWMSEGKLKIKLPTPGAEMFLYLKK